MANITSPTIISGFLERKWEDSGIYSVYSYRAENMAGNEELCFAVFYSSQNDMNQSWMHNVQLLYENGQITNGGNVFINSNWKIHAVLDENNRIITLYANDNNEWVLWSGKPITRMNKEMEKSKWPIHNKDEFYNKLNELKNAE